MITGISTASLFGRFKTEEAIKELNNNGVKHAEVFLESYCEYNKKFGKLIAKKKGETEIHSVHALTTQFEPQLYSLNERAQEDSFKILEGFLKAGKAMGAKNYTFHGSARFKKTPIKINFDRHAQITQRIIDTCAKYGINLAYENVHWNYYNYIGFFDELRKRTNGLKGTFDIKQARQSGIDYSEYIKEMGSDIATVHLSDIDENGKMCLVGKGITDFNEVFKKLKDVGFDGALLLEAYQSDYENMNELYDSLKYVSELAEKIF
ncbi:MAG: sugar phosphate isomerase/epimerase [Clostridia bacterium]|nr:sugar phosphate isomerase/epimerase [Clostridia bacterium]